MLALGAALVGRTWCSASLRRLGLPQLLTFVAVALCAVRKMLSRQSRTESSPSACVPRQDTGTAKRAGQLHLVLAGAAVTVCSASGAKAQAVATIPSNASSSKTRPKPEAWLPRGNVVRPG